ncbi:hypothetical protein LUZ60_011568 [Juncus effusus]|nr:hypothetical protein LUZ60_011568 [Juncus effusus]
MGKGSKRQKKAAIANSYKSKKEKKNEDAVWDEDSEDEIDAFHKQQDLVPLDVNEGESEDEDTEQPIFDFTGEDSDESKSEDDDVDVKGNEVMDRGLARKIERQAKYLKQKFGGGEDEMDEDGDRNNEEESKKNSWGGRKTAYYDADNVDYEIQSSDEEMPAEEEAGVLQIQREKANSLSMADLGLQNDEDESESDQVGLMDSKTRRKKKVNALESSFGDDFDEVKKDHSSLSKEEQMDVVFSSAPELVGLFSELNETLDKLKDLKPDVSKVKAAKDIHKSVMNKLEVGQALLLMYCQAISFYLLLKSEGLPVRDHPVIGCLVDIKNTLEKMKQIKDILPSPVEETFNDEKEADSGNRIVETSDEEENDNNLASFAIVNGKTKFVENEAQMEKGKQEKVVQIGSQSLEMLKIRANLEAKLKERGLYNFAKSKSEQISNGKFDDFDDELQQNAKGSAKTKPSQLLASKAKKAKLVSGDDDLPKRDDIGERRRKHELRVLARVGTKSNDDGDDVGDDVINDDNDDVSEEEVDDDGDAVEDESEDEFYKQAKMKQNKKMMKKELLNAGKQIVPSLEEEQADGKRQISLQIAKNRGLTRARKKLLKNPRKKYRTKHKEWEKKRKGQVRDVRKPSGPYGGEFTGINPNVSKSVRFKG